MKIAIDISQIIYEGTGISVYTKELVRNLLLCDKENYYTLFAFTKNDKKISDYLCELKEYSSNFDGKIIPFPEKFVNILGNYIHFPKIETFIGMSDVYHSSDWIQFPTNAKKVTTVHDLVPFKFPEVSHSYIIKTHTLRLKHVERECNRIICVSNTTKNDLVSAFHINPDRISVIYSGVNRIFRDEADMDSPAQKKYKLPSKYILAVGTLEPRKNLNLLIAAFLNLKKQNKIKEFNLVIVGNRGWGEEIEKNKDIHVTGFIPTSDMPGIYKGAALFVYPSLYEGFGLPILEAMSVGCPVITSNVGSMKEIGEGAAVLIDPTSDEKLGRAISEVLDDKKMGNHLIEKGRERAKKFTWEKTAHETLSVYQSLFKNN